MADPLTQKAGSNQPTKGDFLATIRDLVVLQQERDSAQAAVRLRFKRAKAEGFDIEALKHTMELRKQDPEVSAQQLEARLRYASWSGIPIGTQLALFEDRPTADGLTEKERVAETLFEAEQAGYQAGRAGASKTDSNPHTPGSELFVAHAEGWDRGQAHIAREMAPKDAPKPAKPGRKRKADNPEDGPPKDEAGGDKGSIH